MDRIIAAFTFKTEVYAEVERDESFTTTAWIIVAVVSLLSQIGSSNYDNLTSGIISALVGTVFAIISFAAMAYIINFVGRAIYKADSTFGEIVRTVGLAYVWQIFGLLGIFGLFLICLTGLAQAIAAILYVISAFIAVKEALDLDWVKTIITVILGFLAYIVILAIGSFILGALGLGGALLFGLI